MPKTNITAEWDDTGSLVFRTSAGDVILKLDSASLVAINEAAAIVAAIPTADEEDSATIWNHNGVLKVSSAG